MCVIYISFMLNGYPDPPIACIVLLLMDAQFLHALAAYNGAVLQGCRA